MVNGLYAAGGATYNEIKGEGKLEEYRALQIKNKKAKKAGYDFTSYNSLIKTKFDLLQTYNTFFHKDADYTTAAQEQVARSKAKLAT